MKYIALLLLLSCNHVCPPQTKTITNYTTVVKRLIDTLVIIQTYDSVPEPKLDTSGFYGFYLNSGWEETPFELFKDGKRTDTIRKHTIIYY
jgi:hypothetical protein